MSCACTTCHVIVREGLCQSGRADEAEGRPARPRWGLQAAVAPVVPAIVADRDLTIEIPKYTINHARENH